jgi:hypothetical protein
MVTQMGILISLYFGQNSIMGVFDKEYSGGECSHEYPYPTATHDIQL